RPSTPTLPHALPAFGACDGHVMQHHRRLPTYAGGHGGYTGVVSLQGCDRPLARLPDGLGERDGHDSTRRNSTTHTQGLLSHEWPRFALRPSHRRRNATMWEIPACAR